MQLQGFDQDVNRVVFPNGKGNGLSRIRLVLKTDILALLADGDRKMLRIRNLGLGLGLGLGFRVRVRVRV